MRTPVAIGAGGDFESGLLLLQRSLFSRYCVLVLRLKEELLHQSHQVFYPYSGDCPSIISPLVSLLDLCSALRGIKWFASGGDE